MSVDQASVVEYIKNLKLGEVKALIEVLEEELGVSASAPVMAVAGAVAGAGALGRAGADGGGDAAMVGGAASGGADRCKRRAGRGDDTRGTRAQPGARRRLCRRDLAGK